MKKLKDEQLKVTVDKRHVISIGEKLYSESVELIRELVNNAYDADASEVHVTITPESVEVKDNGSGMDMEGLKQYFIIGSDEKVIHSRSPKYDRVRIGQFGIGKFASLAAANRFEVTTQHKDFAARVVFERFYHLRTSRADLFASFGSAISRVGCEHVSKSRLSQPRRLSSARPSRNSHFVTKDV